ncbi:hypothetical protein KOW79_022513 [Hemibagrus wyckioides]|uniref:Replication factor C subunit 1 n=1 Tax=Hemibagrus wyckioides TaxID=337641 RepID=A0A9D3S812_9TELE|nr:replication factor C subunit 1 [Hemibagrus wyckioides]KAG7314017.1 hypothetical protein KOW79_022513 [Hemibagrus wyckioides]
MDIRRFFAPKPGHGGGSSSTDDEPKNKKKPASKATSSRLEEKRAGKRKKRVIADSDEEEEEKIGKKSPKEKPSSSEKKDPVTYVSDSDSDEAFLSLKKPSKLKQNGCSKDKKDLGSKEMKAKQVKTPPVQSPSPKAEKVAAKKNALSPKSPPKPTAPKHTPTSVFDYFGNTAAKRSDKKLVASTSTKRKAPTQDPEETHDDAAIAKQLQMDEDMELEKQIHEDEEFARTLAMLDEAPQPKKARVDSPSKTSSRANGAETKPSPKKPSPKKPSPKKSPVKASSKLALMKRKADEEEEWRKSEKKEEKKSKLVISPKKEPITQASSETAATPKSGVSAGSTKRISTPRSGGGSTKTSPTKPETSPDDAEKKRVNSAAYRNFLNREGPRALGSKQIPQGEENCLEGCVFVLTGVLESMERDDAKSLIERYGGKVTGNVSRKTTYLVLGRDSGVSKTEKAQSFGTKIINEDELLDLIRTKPGKKSKYEIAAEAENKATKSRTPDSKGQRTPTGRKVTPQKRSASKSSPSPAKRQPSSSSTPGKSRATRQGPSSEVRKTLEFDAGKSTEDGSSLLWVDKYRPRALKNLIGQQGEQSCANKLLRWLKDWHKNHSGNAKPAAARFGKFGGKNDGTGFKAALLSGPPGVGKTTTAALVCEELGYSYVEMNASCTRSKNSLKEVIAESLNNTSIKNFYTGASQTVSNKHVLIMDEVDGMAGNEDRGGIQEMIGLIKSSKIPIICMCNDRNHTKIRSLANYCFDLRFQRPRVEQIKGAMMSIAFKEGLKIPPPALNEVILASNQDVRQVLHNLSMWSATDKVMTYDQAKADANKAKKDMKMGPFDVCRKVFVTGEETAHMSLMDKSDLFFHDYSLAPLFVQENYIHVRPAAAGGNLKNHLVLLSKTADSICDGDLVDRQIRSRQVWSLLPTQAVYASVLPGELMRGYMSQFPTFPSWLGKFSSTSKHSRIVQELSSHMSLKTLSSKEAVNLDYLPYLRSALLEPLRRHGTDGAAQSVKLMDDYDIIKEDFDSIMEISTWGEQPDPYSKLDSKVKAAFTRAYNKESHLTPYSLQVVKKGRRGAVDADQALDPDNDLQGQEEEEEETVNMDAMIKQKKAKATKEVKQEKAEDSGKGKGKGKGKGRK